MRKGVIIFLLVLGIVKGTALYNRNVAAQQTMPAQTTVEDAGRYEYYRGMYDLCMAFDPIETCQDVVHTIATGQDDPYYLDSPGFNSNLLEER